VVSNNSQIGKIEKLFNQLAGEIFSSLEAEEQLSLSLQAEESQFTRINGGRIRQTGFVNDCSVYLDLVVDNRRATASLTLTGDIGFDVDAVQGELNRLREEVPQLPEDPYIVLPAGGETSHTSKQGVMLEADESTDKLLPVLQAVDLSGIWASGRVYRGNANSAGNRHWFATDSFSLDYSLVNAKEKMVKATFAGSDWKQDEYEQSLLASIEKLKMLDSPSIKIKPGNYRTFIASAGVADLLNMFSWDGLSELSMQTGESAFLKMRNENITLSPLFSLAEDFSNGLVPGFNEQGEVSPQRIELIERGELKSCLISSRTAKEYGLDSNFAEESEYLRSPVMAVGELPEADVLQALGTGVYLSNLHYLNWSDVVGGRITGMTRYACFWVEDGEIKGPIENMRFDDSFYNFFGDNLEAVTAEAQINPDVGTYENRSLEMTECPGILLNSFALTL